ncbi:hypothetical protein [Bacillus sp. UMB0893]|uniref:hypothetical protein n=1 Tax=Bacillus sp. UMB0893 TaxID=2066053 RepID=UPI0008A9765B|nr:hypothetical protein [Bacillus sp. UMB0893]OHR74071.1 hypothetical protein HMPREF3291_00125 [Bacillus sp. HMSC76G11]PLR65631.1 hypothetical protein CYJ36_22540 [Bacillus sp. UMB0893]
MARNRNKDYSQGDRINIYLSRDVPPEFIEWINKQSDLSSFFLFAAQKLYQQTGFIDVSEIMPRKINFDLSSVDKSPVLAPKTEEIIHQPEQSVDLSLNKDESLSEGIDETEEEKKQESWANLDKFDDDPFA